MTINEILRGPTWTCQWRCPLLGEVHRTRSRPPLWPTVPR
jgi:hypothetical protein